MLYYPIQEDDPRTALPDAAVRILARHGIVDRQRVLLGGQPQPGRHLLPRLDVLARQRVGTEYRYMLGPQAQGNLRYYWLDEKEAIVNGASRNARQSKSIQCGLSRISRSASRRAAGRLLHNVTVQQTYSHDFRRPPTATAPSTAGVSDRGATCR